MGFQKNITIFILFKKKKIFSRAKKIFFARAKFFFILKSILKASEQLVWSKETLKS
jgi:hypothetical protein